MPANLTRVIRAICSNPWAIQQEKLDAICAIVELRANGGQLSKDEIRAALGGDEPRPVTRESGGAIAVIPLYGIIAHRMNLLMAFSGGTSLGHFRNQLRKAVDDSEIGAIILDIDSPGGSTFMLNEAAADIRDAKAVKPVIAVVNPLMASAALWLGAQASELVITPSGEAGSLGVFMVHEDYSKQNEALGLKVTYIASKVSPHKVEGNSDEPLKDETRAYLQGRVDAVADDFVKAVAKGRGLKVTDVKANFGQGRTLFANEALAAKMVDRVETLEATIGRLSKSLSGRSRRRAEGEGLELLTSTGASDVERATAGATAQAAAAAGEPASPPADPASPTDSGQSEADEKAPEAAQAAADGAQPASDLAQDGGPTGGVTGASGAAPADAEPGAEDDGATEDLRLQAALQEMELLEASAE